jgi:hypothetical protein
MKKLLLGIMLCFSIVSFAQTGGSYTPPSGGPSINVSDSAWSLLGNNNTIQSTNFLGTTNNVGLSFRTNNTIRQTITNTGNVGIGITNPTEMLEVGGNITTQTAANQNARVSVYAGTGTTVAELNLGRNGVRIWHFGLQATNRFSFVESGIAERLSILQGGNVGIGTTTPNAQLQLSNTVANRKIVLYEDANNDNQYYGLGINSGVLRYQIPAVGHKHIFYAGTSETASNALMTIQGNGNVGIGITTPTSTLHIQGSQAGVVTNITATTTLNATHHKILVRNGATAITITFPDALTCLGREYVISRAAGSTGSITIQRTGTNVIQALNGTTGATTSIGLHSATGGGLNIRFTAVNIGGVGTWVRI